MRAWRSRLCMGCCDDVIVGCGVLSDVKCGLCITTGPLHMPHNTFASGTHPGTGHRPGTLHVWELTHAVTWPASVAAYSDVAVNITDSPGDWTALKKGSPAQSLVEFLQACSRSSDDNWPWRTSHSGLSGQRYLPHSSWANPPLSDAMCENQPRSFPESTCLRPKCWKFWALGSQASLWPQPALLPWWWHRARRELLFEPASVVISLVRWALRHVTVTSGLGKANSWLAILCLFRKQKRDTMHP